MRSRLRRTTPFGRDSCYVRQLEQIPLPSLIARSRATDYTDFYASRYPKNKKTL